MCQALAQCPRHRAIVLAHHGTDFFTAMSLRLAGEGGLMSEEALQARLHRHGRTYAKVAAWLQEGRLRRIGWGSQRWLPMFQLTPRYGLRSDVAAVADELAGAMDDLEILAWFACPNTALDGETPLARLRAGLPDVLPDVLHAARLDHFLASS